DPSRMCADVYDIIIGTAPSTAGMTDKELLQHAASFEHQRVDPTAALGNAQHNIFETIAPSNMGAAPELRIGHVQCRHTREFNDFQLGGSSRTTLYPRQMNSKQALKDLAKDSIEAGPAYSPANGVALEMRPGTTTPKRVPPQDADDIPSTGFLKTDATHGGDQSRIGFTWLGPPQNKARITQFFPQAGPNLVTIRNSDLARVKGALQP
ncbi:MAG: hypothetical protein AAGB05_07725, partial [Pseudomonadota bacterium]